MRLIRSSRSSTVAALAARSAGRLFIAGLLAGLLLSLGRTPRAEANDWTAAGGDWNTAGNWSGGIPDTISENATFNTASAKTVTFGAAVGGVSGFNGIVVNSAQTGALSINNTANSVQNFRIGNATGISIGSGAGAFTLEATGGASSGILLILNTTATYTFLNNSGNTATISLGSGAIQGGGGTTPTVAFDGTGDWIVNSRIVNQAGATPVTKSGTGTLTLAGASTYTGGTTLSNGQLNINNATALGGAAGAFTISGTSIIDNTSGGSITLSNNNAQNWNADFTFAGSHSLNMGTGAVAMNANRQVTVSANTLTVGGAISGSGFSLTKAGTGMLTLTAANTYSGGTTINLGTLNAQASGSTTVLGSGSVAVSGGTLRVTNTATGARTVANTLTGNGTVEFASTGTPTQANFRTQLTGTVSGFTGDFHVLSSGHFAAWDATGITPVATTNQNVTIDPGGFLLLIAVSGTPTTSFGALSGGGTVNTNSGTTNSTILSIGNGGASDDFSGVISDSALTTGTLRLVKNGSGTQILSGTNTYRGTTTISGGVLQIGNGGTDGTLGTGSVTDDASLVFNRSNAYTVGNTISGSGSVTQDGSGTTTLTANNGYGGGTTVNNGTLNIGNGGGTGTVGSGGLLIEANGAVVLNKNGTYTFSNVVTGTGAFTLAGTSATSTLNGDWSAFAGTITIQSGGRWRSAASTSTSANADWVIDGILSETTTGSGGWTANFGSLAGSGSISAGGGATALNVVVGQNGNSTTWSGTFSSGGNGVNNVTKTGSGTLTLTGANAHTGLTTVNDGTLWLNGTAGFSHSEAGAYTVGNGGTLKGDGNLAGHAITFASGSTGAPGNSPGLMPAGSQSWDDNSTYEWEVAQAGTAGVDYDTYAVSGLLDFSAISGTMTLELIKWPGGSIALTDTFALWTYGALMGWDALDNVASGKFTLVSPDNSVNYSSAYVYNDGEGTIWLTGIYVPEPSTYALALLGLAGLGLFALRKKYRQA